MTSHERLLIHDWPRQDRPREKLLDRGASELTDSELLAVLLGTGDGARSNALELARALLDRMGGLDAVVRAGGAALLAVPGVGATKLARLRAAVELGRRLEARPVERARPFRSGRDVYDRYRARLAHLRREVFLVVMLDARNRPFREERVSEGSLTASIVHPREVFEPLIRESAAAAIFVHNHPSGDPQPSPDDLDITRRLRAVGELTGIRVVDHVIVAADGYTSLAESGWPT